MEREMTFRSKSMIEMKEHASQPGSRRSSNASIDEMLTADLTHRRLRRRHIQLLGFGGAIGTNVFGGVGVALNYGGPISLIIGITISTYRLLANF